MRTLLCSLVILLLSVASAAVVFADDAGSVASLDGATPVSNVTTPPSTTAQTRTDLLARLDQLQKQRAALLNSTAGLSPDDLAAVQDQADTLLRKITKIRSELLNLSVQ